MLRNRTPCLRGIGRNSTLLINRHFVSTLTFSSQFDNAAWTKGATTVTADSTADPFGFTTADSLVENAALGNHFVFRAVTGTRYSVYAKASTRTWVVVGDDSGAHWTFFDLANGAFGTQTGLSSRTAAYFGNGWWRITAESASFSGNFTIWMASGNNGNSYQGDNASKIFLWGADAR